MNSASGPIRIFVALFGAGLILLGFCLVAKIVTIPVPPLWISAIVMIAGITMLSPSEPKLQIIFGLLFFSVGTFLALRTINIITKPWLQYGLGAGLILGGVTMITYSVIGGTRKQNHPDKT